MSTKLSEEKYKDLKKIATQEHKKYDVEEMTADEKDKISSRIVNNRKFVAIIIFLAYNHCN